MSAEIKKEIQMEIAHVLFIDIVGYSKLSINEQRGVVDELNEIVRASKQFQEAEARGRLIKIPTGDGMALVFYTSPEAPAQCAIEICRAFKERPRLHLRMGVHSGPVSGVIDVNGHANLAGAGLNVAQRVMACGDAGHILLSKHVADDLEQYPRWRPHLHDLGECEVKHGGRVHGVNLYTEELGNSELPEKFKLQRGRKKAAMPMGASLGRSAVMRWAGVAAVILILGGIGVWLLRSKSSTKAPANAVVASSIATPSPSIPEKSIAVLPFENLSSDKENAYFADGIHSGAGFTPSELDTVAKVSFEKIGENFQITRIELETSADVPAVEETTFRALAADAKKNCPVSKALAATEIKLKAMLSNAETSRTSTEVAVGKD